MSKIRANKEGNIRQRPDGRWEVRVTVGLDFATGKPKRVSRYADTQEEAVKLLHEMSVMRDTSPNSFTCKYRSESRGCTEVEPWYAGESRAIEKKSPHGKQTLLSKGV